MNPLKYSYNNYIKTISVRFENLLKEMAAEYNFDNGLELEIAICTVLRAIRPERYGVSRGFILTADGNMARDDIIIHERSRFRLLRLINESDFCRKQQVPVESVYAYIEAKHSLILEGEGPQRRSNKSQM